MLSTLAIFAVGFVARPFGGFLFGWIGDRIGRKASMTLAVGLASVGSLMIGIAPTFAAVGVWASLTLLVARLIQGLGGKSTWPMQPCRIAPSSLLCIEPGLAGIRQHRLA